ncbi:STAS/SEC14 domain-containing protein [Sphingobium algorifonticola]|uniref:STAS/SEC14 domain-containing protein n=1 Tax=Sphingobium algorifonticola TaxID=2008318 RepID=A0A437J8F5_9SPHN|nr:STAS/SEC14 domain-containing protein [Sphingobium algorifonticola]RVT41781.1 STAS/SEC14 domain-containing protein [Sphingobium algorifonticola]
MITLETHDNLVRLHTVPVTDVHQLEREQKELTDAIVTMMRQTGTCNLLVICAELLPAALTDMLEHGIARLHILGVRHVAIVVSSALIRLQIKRVVQDAPGNSALFATEDEARAWLKERPR